VTKAISRLWDDVKNLRNTQNYSASRINLDIKDVGEDDLF